MRITQSISLSNIHALRFIGEARPWGRGNLPCLTACSRIGVTLCVAAIRKQQMSMVELIGIEPMTPCLQSRCSPN